jgi:hypothetical protein
MCWNEWLVNETHFHNPNPALPLPHGAGAGSFDGKQLYHPLKTRVAIFLVLIAYLPVFASDWWISQNGSGSVSGADSNDCQTIAWVSAYAGNGTGTSPYNWGAGAGQIAPGDTVHLVGYLTNTLNTGSGTLGSPVTIHFEPGARFSAPTLPFNQRWILGQNAGSSNLVIDGGLNGVMELTDNGTVSSNGGTMNFNNSQIAGISISGANVTIENLTVSNIFQRQTNNERQQGGSDGTGMFWSGNNLLVSNCVFAAVQDGIFVTMGNVLRSNITIVNCLFTNFNHGITVGFGNTGDTNNVPYFSNIRISHCRLYTGDMFESVDTPAFNFSFTNGTNGIVIVSPAITLAPPGTPAFWQAATNILAPFSWSASQAWTNTATNTITGCYTNAQGQAIAVDAAAQAIFVGQMPLNLFTFTNVWFCWSNSGPSAGSWVPFWKPPELLLHRNPIFIFDDAPGGTVSNVEISYDYIQAGWRPKCHIAGTGAMYMECASDTMLNHVRVFNNISVTASNAAYSGGGGLCAAGGMDVLVANNTMVAGTGAGQMSVCGTNAYLYNNILVSGNGTSLGTWIGAVSAPTNLTWSQMMSGDHADCNLYNNQGGAAGFVAVVYQPITDHSWFGSGWQQDTFTQWTNTFPASNGFDFDIHSLTNLLQYDSNYIPLSNSVAVNAGTNLTAWGITNDYLGNPRPSTGNWTLGAFQNPTNGVNINTNGSSAGVSGNNVLVTSGTLLLSSGFAGGYGGPTAPGIGVSNFVAGGAGLDVRVGLLLQYTMNQNGSADNVSVLDASGNGYTGTSQDSAYWSVTNYWTNGLAGSNALSLPDNQGAYTYNSGVSSPLVYAGPWTITFWVQQFEFPGAAQYAVTTTSGSGIAVGPAWCGFYDGTNSLAGPALAATNWYFVAVSKSGGDSYTVYVNGTNNMVSGLLGNVDIGSLYIGHREGYAWGMNGKIEDFRIYNRALAPVEIETLTLNGPDDAAAWIPIPPAGNGQQAPGVGPRTVRIRIH